MLHQCFISDFDKWINEPTQKSLCSCSDGDSINCSVDVLGPIYPGQNAVFSLALADIKQLQYTVSISLETIDYSPLQCTVATATRQQNVSSHQCVAWGCRFQSQRDTHVYNYYYRIFWITIT